MYLFYILYIHCIFDYYCDISVVSNKMKNEMKYDTIHLYIDTLKSVAILWIDMISFHLIDINDCFRSGRCRKLSPRAQWILAGIRSVELVPSNSQEFFQSSHLYFQWTLTQKRHISINIELVTSRVQDYLDSETRYRNDVIVSLCFG